MCAKTRSREGAHHLEHLQLFWPLSRCAAKRARAPTFDPPHRVAARKSAHGAHVRRCDARDAARVKSRCARMSDAEGAKALHPRRRRQVPNPQQECQHASGTVQRMPIRQGHIRHAGEYRRAPPSRPTAGVAEPVVGGGLLALELTAPCSELCAALGPQQRLTRSGC